MKLKDCDGFWVGLVRYGPHSLKIVLNLAEQKEFLCIIKFLILLEHHNLSQGSSFLQA